MDWTPFLAPTYGLIGTLAGSLTVAIVTHRFSSRRFITEKVWERRREAYSEVVSSLINMRECSKNLARGYSDNAVHFDSSSSRDRFNDEMWSHWKPAKTHFTCNILVASDRFRKEFSHLIILVQEVGSDPNEIMPEWIDDLNDKLWLSTETIVEIAKGELTGSAVRIH